MNALKKIHSNFPPLDILWLGDVEGCTYYACGYRLGQPLEIFYFKAGSN